jgi:hypothetical protein
MAATAGAEDFGVIFDGLDADVLAIYRARPSTTSGLRSRTCPPRMRRRSTLLLLRSWLLSTSKRDGSSRGILDWKR